MPGRRIPVPMRIVNRDIYERTLPVVDLNRLIDSAPVKDVPIASLVAIQHTVDKDRVQAYIDNPKLIRRGTKHDNHGGVVDLPIVIHFEGTNYLHDGHHRTTAQKLLGASVIECRYVDLDRYFGRKAA